MTAGLLLADGGVPARAAGVSLGTPAPNYFYDPSQSAAGVTAMVDPVNHRLFEYVAGSYYHGGQSVQCPNLVALDTDSYATVATGPSGQSCPGYKKAQTDATEPMAAIDSTDKLLFFAVIGGSIDVVDEATLLPRATWSLPTAFSNVDGLSWYAPADELIVLGDASGAAAVVGVNGASAPPSVADFPITTPLPASAPPSNWLALVTQCTSALSIGKYTSSAYRSTLQPAVYVPCVLAGSARVPGAPTGDHEGIVKILLTQGCAATAACQPQTDAVGNAVELTAPAPSTGIGDFLFDQGYDRGYMPQDTTSGSTIYVYDGGPVGQNGRFIGRFAVGNHNDTNAIILGVDQATGRMYAAGPSSGVTLIDGRRTPVNAGSAVAVAGWAAYGIIPILPPDAQHPSTRVLLNYKVSPDPNYQPAKDPTQCYSCPMPYFTVLDDSVAVSADGQPANPDVNTQPIPAGQSAQSDYAGNARGYGFHQDLVGGTGGPVNNLPGNASDQCAQSVGTTSLPYCGVITDALGGNIDQLRLNNGTGTGLAAPVHPGNPGVSDEYTKQTGQPWPYPDVRCTNPGGSLTGSSGGQSGNGTDGSAYLSCVDPAPNVAAQGWNGAQTPSAGSAWGVARVQGGHAANSGFGTVDLGSSTAVGYVDPAPQTATGAVTSYVYAASSGVRISFGPLGSVSFGEVSQTATATANGVAGGAKATDTVALGDVVVTQPGSAPLQLCGSVCGNDAAVIEQINNIFAAEMHISQPQPDHALFAGSPGGYVAGVQSDASEQYGDTQFNGMAPEEAQYLPAMRIVLYDDGSFQLSREIVDLAGVAIAADKGNTLNTLPAPSGPTNATEAGQYAGVIGASTGAGLGEVLVTPAGQVGGTAAGAGSLSVLAQVLGRALNGLQFLLRNPLAAAEMISTLLLLGLPYLLMDRRRLWLRDVFGHQRG